MFTPTDDQLITLPPALAKAEQVKDLQWEEPRNSGVDRKDLGRTPITRNAR